AEFEHLFHHLALLVDLDRVNTAIAALVLVLVDAVWEGPGVSPRRCFRISAKRIRIGRLMPRRTSVSTSCLRSMERAASFSGCTRTCPLSPTEKYPLPQLATS